MNDTPATPAAVPPPPVAPPVAPPAASSVALTPGVPLDAPYCGVCGYHFTGLIDSGRCPECGRPVVDVLTRGTGAGRQSVRYQSRARLFGVPLVAVAYGPIAGETRGHARGILAIGQVATGVLAVGVFARGGVAVGVFAAGGLAVGTCVAGVIAVGSLAAGVVAVGALAVGLWSVGSVSVSVVNGVGVRHLRLWRP
jgi:hypothetical protein